MLQQNFRILLKQLLRNKTFSIITIAGFSFALMFVILLSIYVQQELSVDDFHVNKNRIFRLTNESASSFAPPIGELLKDMYPEIESYTRVYSQDGVLSELGKQKIRTDFLMVDSSFFTMFSFHMIEGQPSEVLTGKNSIVLSHSFAKKLFGNKSPLGKEVELDLRHKFIVTGVVEDFPENTHFKSYSAFVNFTCLADFWGWPELLTTYGNSSFAIYFMAKPNTDLVSKESAILEMFMKDYWVYKGGYVHELKMEPLSDIYFGGKNGSGAKGNSKKLIVVLTAISFIILLLAIINYINLSIAQASMRSREVAVKKLLGSTKTQIFLQFILESVFLCVVAFNIALVLSKLAEPVFNSLFNTQLTLSQKFNINTSLAYLLGVIIAGAFSGLIPAWVVVRYKAVDIVKGVFRRRSKGVFGRLLIAIQYCSAIVLIICTWTIALQTSYMKDYNVGFSKSSIMWISNDIHFSRTDALRDELMKIAGVVDVSFVAGSPIDGGNNQSFYYNDKPVSFQEFLVDSAFFEMFAIKSEPTGMAYSKDAIWLNETAIKELELDSLPQTFKFHQTNLPVYGVLKDFHFKDLRQKIGPAMVRMLPKDKFAWKIFVKLTDENLQESVNQVSSIYSGFTNGIPMQYGFVDDTIYKWYEKEEKTAKTIGYLTILAIIISVMGILAMATFYIEQRVKEIGIRKVTGANALSIVWMLNFDFIKWVLISFVFACPLAYYAMSKWLANFPYKTPIYWWVFFLSGIIALGFALLTISWQTWRCASRNPVEALRYE
jgi:putative ABC transport system permease protein